MHAKYMSACWKNSKEKQMKLMPDLLVFESCAFPHYPIENTGCATQGSSCSTVDEGYSEAGVFHCVILPNLQF